MRSCEHSGRKQQRITVRKSLPVKKKWTNETGRQSKGVVEGEESIK